MVLTKNINHPTIKTSQPSSILTNFKISKDCLSFSLKKPQTTKQTNPLTQNSNTHLLIRSLNIRGLHNQTKLNCLLQYIIDKKYLIFGLSETKLSQTQIPKITSTPYHTIWNPTKNNTKAGTALIIHKTLLPHLYKTEKLESYIISCFFQFKPKIKLCISQIYIPHDLKEKKLALTHLITLINKNSSHNIEHIIMGDFNSTPNPIIDKLNYTSHKPESKIYQYLNNYSDTYRITHPQKKSFTCTSSTNESRIDQIWISQKLTPYLTKAKIIPTENTFPSDHKITSITIENFLSIQNIKKKKYYIPNEKKITTETWDKIKSKITKLNIHSSKTIDQQWNQLNNKLIKTKKNIYLEKK